MTYSPRYYVGTYVLVPAIITRGLDGDREYGIEVPCGAGEEVDTFTREDQIVSMSVIPPTTREIIAAIDRGDRVEVWDPAWGKWRLSYSVSCWVERCERHGDQPQPGYRIVRGDQ